MYTEITDRAPATATLRSVRIDGVATVNAENLAPAGTDGLLIDGVERNMLPGTPPDGIAADGGVSVENLGTRLSVTLDTSTDSTDPAGPQPEATIYRHNGSDWVDVGATEADDSESALTTTVTGDGVYVPVSRSGGSNNGSTSSGSIDSCTTID